MRKVLVLVLVPVLVLSLYRCVLCAPTTNGSISGRVTDASKATIAEAKVAAVNPITNFRYETATNGSGEYTLANLRPGTYQIEVENSGFKKLIRPDVILGRNLPDCRGGGAQRLPSRKCEADRGRNPV